MDDFAVLALEEGGEVRAHRAAGLIDFEGDLVAAGLSIVDSQKVQQADGAQQKKRARCIVPLLLVD